jgi:hypothetical protein
MVCGPAGKRETDFGSCDHGCSSCEGLEGPDAMICEQEDIENLGVTIILFVVRTVYISSHKA